MTNNEDDDSGNTFVLDQYIDYDNDNPSPDGGSSNGGGCTNQNISSSNNNNNNNQLLVATTTTATINLNNEYDQIKYKFLNLLKQFKIFEFDKFMKWLEKLVFEYQRIGYNVIENLENEFIAFNKAAALNKQHQKQRSNILSHQIHSLNQQQQQQRNKQPTNSNTNDNPRSNSIDQPPPPPPPPPPPTTTPIQQQRQQTNSTTTKTSPPKPQAATTTNNNNVKIEPIEILSDSNDVPSPPPPQQQPSNQFESSTANNNPSTLAPQLLNNHNLNNIRLFKSKINEQQITALESVFKQKQYLNQFEKEQLSTLLNLTPEQIKSWFKNRRYKQKKLETTQKYNQQAINNGNNNGVTLALNDNYTQLSGDEEDDDCNENIENMDENGQQICSDDNNENDFMVNYNGDLDDNLETIDDAGDNIDGDCDGDNNITNHIDDEFNEYDQQLNMNFKSSGTGAPSTTTLNLSNAYNYHNNHHFQQQQQSQQHQITSSLLANSTYSTKPFSLNSIKFSKDLNDELERVFEKQKYITNTQRDYLAQKFHVVASQITNWFQNKRRRLKRLERSARSSMTNKNENNNNTSSINNNNSASTNVTLLTQPTQQPSLPIITQVLTSPNNKHQLSTLNISGLNRPTIIHRNNSSSLAALINSSNMSVNITNNNNNNNNNSQNQPTPTVIAAKAH